MQRPGELPSIKAACALLGHLEASLTFVVSITLCDSSQAALMKLGIFTVAMVLGPIGTYFLTLKHIWGGEKLQSILVR